MKEIIAKMTGAVHTRTHTQGDLENKINVRTYCIRPWNNIRAKHEIIETDQLLI